jgi:putative FmdB family regulatory protein
MPVYIFDCSRCNSIFEKSVPMSLSLVARPSCPACGKRRCTRNYNECISIRGVDATPKTLGGRADRNTDRFSEDKKQHLIDTRDKELNIKKDIEIPGLGKPTRGTHSHSIQNRKVK